MTTEEPLMPDTPAATDTPRTEAGRNIVGYLRAQGLNDDPYIAPQAKSAYLAAARSVEVALVQVESEAAAPVSVDADNSQIPEPPHCRDFEAVAKVAAELVAAVDGRHDNADPPRRYIVPWEAVTQLRQVLAVTPQVQADPPAEGLLRAIRRHEGPGRTRPGNRMDQPANVAALDP